jgi:predicted nucleotide-binding protein
MLIKQDDGTNHIAFILAGSVTIKRNNREIAERSAGECVGEMSLIDVKHARSATVLAKEVCVVASVSETQFTKVANRYSELWRCLAKQCADRLRQRLQGVRPRNKVPRLFIGSSKESLEAAEGVRETLKRVACVTLWSKGVFGPGKFTLEALEEQGQKVDFAVMVFGPDDVIFSRGRRFEGPRDNVILEMGLFTGALGRKRAFVVAPHGRELKIPSDLLGVNFVRYTVDRKQPLAVTIRAACEDLRKVIREEGPI